MSIHDYNPTLNRCHLDKTFFHEKRSKNFNFIFKNVAIIFQDKTIKRHQNKLVKMATSLQ